MKEVIVIVSSILFNYFFIKTHENYSVVTCGMLAVMHELMY